MTPGMDNTYPARAALATFYQAEEIGFAAIRGGVSEEIDVLVWGCHSSKLPEDALDEETKASLRRFLKRGKGRFLAGFATANRYRKLPDALEKPMADTTVTDALNHQTNRAISTFVRS